HTLKAVPRKHKDKIMSESRSNFPARHGTPWREMMELRTRYEIHRLDLIAYIIQSGAEVDNFYRITPKISNNTSNQRQPNESDCHN
ncbi:TPA: hypothetical protein ACVEGN_005125, partial [Escherichia coli]